MHNGKCIIGNWYGKCWRRLKSKGEKNDDCVNQSEMRRSERVRIFHLFKTVKHFPFQSFIHFDVASVILARWVFFGSIIEFVFCCLVCSLFGICLLNAFYAFWFWFGMEIVVCAFMIYCIVSTFSSNKWKWNLFYFDR